MTKPLYPAAFVVMLALAQPAAAQGIDLMTPDAGERYAEILRRAFGWIGRPQLEAIYTPFGAGCPGGTGLTPTLAARFGSRPRPGEKLLVRVENLANNTAAFMAVGFSSIPTGIDLTDAGLWGCKAYLDVDVLIPLPVQRDAPFAEWRFDMPLHAPVGIRFYNQAIILDPDANPAGVIVSNAAEIRIVGGFSVPPGKRQTLLPRGLPRSSRALAPHRDQ